ncbi:MAG TPA: cation-translocating P-type ATPase C-terminal domain-containing protein, partial [Kofleriaceae bacterium]|nr:cation-translocating P-type ATPase C-terminal domain-containing protein [Kofleriaceae bacterium]
ALSLDLFKDPWLVAGLVLGNALQFAVIYVPAFNDIFHTVPIPRTEALAIGAVGSLVLWIEEIRKLIVRAHDRRAHAQGQAHARIRPAHSAT